jgi:hypothetical protein
MGSDLEISSFIYVDKTETYKRSADGLIKVRLHGLESEIQPFVEHLAKDKHLEVFQVTKPYPDRGNSQYVRVYVELRKK